MTEYRVIIPDEKPRIIEFVQDGLYGIAYINRSLIDFQPKEAFSWHLSIMLDIEDTVRNGMPSKKERALLDEFGDVLDTNIRGQDKQKPNALFPEPADKYLQQIIDANSSSRPFDYRIDPDKDWKLAEWHLTRNI
jgi:hypothetical protein